MFLSENKLVSGEIHTEPEYRKGGRAYTVVGMTEGNWLVNKVYTIKVVN